jgi:GH24 family phage-related lysozyme (muramidase)
MRVDGAPSKVMTPAYSTEIEESGHGGSSYYEQVHFINSIEGTAGQQVTVEEGFWSIVVGSAAEASLRTGKVINIDQHLADNKVKI